MERIKLGTDKISPLAETVVAGFHRTIVEQVQTAVARDRVVVVGMAQNPVVKRARAMLDKEGVAFTYLEYGSYVSKWKERLAIKLWAGFPTFPMIFVDGTLVGGNSELVKFHADGKLKS